MADKEKLINIIEAVTGKKPGEHISETLLKLKKEQPLVFDIIIMLAKA